MKRRRVLVAAGLALLAGLGLGLWGRPAPPYDISPESFAALRGGMSAAEVEGVLGGPAHAYADVAFCWWDRCEPGYLGEWYANGQNIQVVFHKDAVVDKRLRAADGPPSFSRPSSRTWLGRLRLRLGLWQ